MYLFDFFKNLFKKNNVGVIIWMVLNLLLITWLFSGGFAEWQGALLGLGIYLFSMLIALSPIGEWILRLQNGCKKIIDPQVLQRIEPLFNELYQKAKALNPELNDGIKIFMSNNDEPNAFATGRKTLCITRGLLKYSDEHIKGVLAHEFGHLAHKDTDTILVVAVGNMIVSAIFVVIRFVANLFFWIATFISAINSDNIGGVIGSIFSAIARVVADFILVLLMRAWTQLGVWLCMHSSRKNEYRADNYAKLCGYSEALCEVLESFGTERSKNGLFAALSSSHPENIDRSNALRESAE